MTLQLELKPSTQAKLHDESVRLGLHDEELARQLIDRALNPEISRERFEAIKNLREMRFAGDQEEQEIAQVILQARLEEEHADCELCR